MNAIQTSHCKVIFISDVGFPMEVNVQALLDAVVQFLTDLPQGAALKHIMVINKDEHISAVLASAFQQVSGIVSLS